MSLLLTIFLGMFGVPAEPIDHADYAEWESYRNGYYHGQADERGQHNAPEWIEDYGVWLEYQ